MSPRLAPLALLSLGTAAVLAACSDSTGVGSGAPPCPDSVNVSVTGGTTPTFSWTPACRVFFLNVELPGGADQWNVISDSANAIAPPVTYGTVPLGAVGTPGATPLSVGTSYTVYLFRWTGPGAQDGVLVGSKSFTP